MTIADYIGEPQMTVAPEELWRRMEKLEQLVQLLYSRIETDTGEELLTAATQYGYKPAFGPSRAEKMEFGANNS